MPPAEKIGRFLRLWWRDIALAGAGAALGLLVIVAVEWENGPAPAPRAPDPLVTVAPKADQPVLARRRPVQQVPRELPQAAPPITPEMHSAPPAGPADVPDLQTAPPAGPAVAAPPLPAWRRFAASHAAIADRPMIAIVIDDMGLDRPRSAQAIALPGPLTLSFLTYALGLGGQAAAASRHGHELLLHVPMEPDDSGTYAGPKVLATDLAPEEVKRRLDWAFSRFDGYVGINNHMGSRFTADAAGMSLVLQEVARRGLLFVDSRTTPGSVAREVAERLDVPFAERNVFLDDDPSAEAVWRQLAEVERVAARQGYAVAIGHPREATLDALEKWLPSLAGHGFVLVPVSAVVRRRREAG